MTSSVVSLGSTGAISTYESQTTSSREGEMTASSKSDFILGDQLSLSMSSLEGTDPTLDVVLMCEVMEEATYVSITS